MADLVENLKLLNVQCARTAHALQLKHCLEASQQLLVAQWKKHFRRIMKRGGCQPSLWRYPKVHHRGS